MLYYFALLLPSLTGFFWTVSLIIRYRQNFRTQNIFIAGGAAISISTFIWALYFAGVADHSMFYKLETLEAFTTLLLPAILYMCFRTLTNETPFSKTAFLWLTPAVVIGATMTAIYVAMGETRAVHYVMSVMESGGGPVRPGDLEFAMFIVSGPVYSLAVIGELAIVLIYATLRLIKYRHRLSEFFSNMEDKSMENGWALLVGCYLMVVLSLSSYKGRFHYNEQSPLLAALMVCWAVLIYFMGYNVYRLRFTASTLASELEMADTESDETPADEPSTHPGEPETGEAGARYADMIPAFEGLMQKERIFLQADLRLVTLARMMQTNRTYVSRMINEHYGCSFSSLINSQRIAWAQELMRGEPGLTVEQVAERSGFSNVSYFSSTFRQHAGITCREWQKQNRSK